LVVRSFGRVVVLSPGEGGFSADRLRIAEGQTPVTLAGNSVGVSMGMREKMNKPHLRNSKLDSWKEVS
jgi:hypothetical protein